MKLEIAKQRQNEYKAMPGIAKNENGLTYKQQLVVDHWDGNAAETAKRAGLTYSYTRTLLAQACIKNAIQLREQRETRPKRIKTRQQRQEFWSDMMDDETKSDRNRLRASELLGKSEMDFGDSAVNVNVVTIADIFARTGSKRITGPIIDAPALPSGDLTGDNSPIEGKDHG